MQQLWYVAYGSNLSRERFRCYLQGGQPAGGTRHYPGCRDPSEPQADVAVLLDGGVYFAGTSTVWGGGMAFYDADAPSQVAGRAYLLTGEQFSDVVAQEMRQVPGGALDLSLIRGLDRHSYGSGHYETLVRVGVLRGLPMVTFTSDSPKRPVVAPSAAYLRTMAAGVRQTHRWPIGRTAAYLAQWPGAQGVWSASEIASLAS